MIYKYQRNGSIIGYDGALQVGYVEGRLKQRINLKGDSEDYSPFDELIGAGVKIAPYIEPVKTLEQLQNEAVAAMASIVITECRSGTGKLYFSDLNSASIYANAAIQTDIEIYDRAVQLLKWNFAIDAYALDTLFGIEQGGEVPTLDSFIAGLPKL